MNDTITRRPTTANTRFVRQLQQYLRALSYEYPEIPSIAADGIYGPDTEAAVAAFQQLVGLEPTGEMSPETWDILYTTYITTIKAREQPLSFRAFPSSDTIFQSGDFHPSIFSLQHAFYNLSQLYSNFIEPDFTGTIDSKTAANIEEFRRLSLLGPGTYVDKDLWDFVVFTHNSFQN